VEDGWYEGISNGRQGVFPSNYVEKVTEPNPLTNTNNNNNLNSQSNESLNSSQSFIINENSITNESNQNGESQMAIKKNKKVLGIGFGNIFLGNKIELKTKENFNNGEKVTARTQQPVTITSSTTLATEKANSLRKKIKAKVLFDYVPTQQDELKLVTGEVIYILDKNLEDEGWWRGESISTGRIGVFPDNFVEEIIETPIKSENTISDMNVADSNNSNIASKRKQPIQLHSNSNPIMINNQNSNIQTSSATHIM
jgi:hypothetical protein